MTTQADGVHAYSNQEFGWYFTPPTPPTPPPHPEPDILTGTVTGTTIPSRSCDPDPEPDLDNIFPPDYAPEGVSIDADMARAAAAGRNLPNDRKIKWFKKMVQAGGPWDFKTRDPRFEPFGNYHYGAVGIAFGFSENVLLRLAGRAQYEGDPNSYNPAWGTPWGGRPYGDDPRDQRRIRQGFGYAHRHGY